MRFYCIATAVTSFCIITNAMESEESKHPASATIINGDLAGPDEFKYIVALGGDGYWSHGAGTIIHPRWILTARHVAIEVFKSRDDLYFNFSETVTENLVHPKYDNNLDKNYDHPYYTVAKVFCHPISDDNPVFETDSDISLLKLRAPIPINQPPFYLKAIDIYPKKLNPEKEYLITVVGWGRTVPNKSRTDYRLRKARIPTLKITNLHNFPYFRPKQQIAIYKKNQSFCQRDSGGPGVITGKDGKEYLAGVISYTSFPFCEAEDFLINAHYYKPWIKKVMKKEKDKYLCRNNVAGREYNRRLKPYY